MAQKTTSSRIFSGILAVLIMSGCAHRSVMQGRIVIAQQKLPYLAQQDILLKRNLKTAYRADIDKFGFFEFKGVNTKRTYSIGFDSLPKALEGSVFYIADLKGNKIKEINLRKDFAFRMLDVEMEALTVEDDNLDEKIKEFKKGMASEMLVRKYIHYETGSYLISKENRRYINAIAKVLKENNTFQLKVNSHADAIGNDDFNLALSVKRANEIRNYLVKKGISPDRILTYGYGESRPVNPCTNGVSCSELQHRQNRRTEFVFKVKKEGAISVRG